MHILVNGVRLFFDVEGAEWVPDGDRLRRKPTLILLHGGPGFDHATFKPTFSALADTAQIIYLDHRGQGRSEEGDRRHWTLDQWADDVRGLCDALGIERPVVLGNSFGGMVAQAYAVRHPGHAAGIVLSSTAARMNMDWIVAGFERRGGPAIRAAAEAFWRDVRAEKAEEFTRVCMPYYTATQPPDGLPGRARSIIKSEVLEHFSGRAGEMWRMDFRPHLGRIDVPVLVLAGALDPVTTIEAAEEIVAHLPPERCRYVRFDHCGHGTFRDDLPGTMAVLREFMAGLG